MSDASSCSGHEHTRFGCCAFHMIGLGFPSEAGGQPSDGPPPSFADQTASAVSQHCRETLNAGSEFSELPSPDRRIIFQNATVIPMVNETRLDRRDVVVRGQSIEAIVPAGQADANGATEIDATGKYLLPGFADMHTHVLTRNWAETMTDRFKEDYRPEDFTLPMGLAMLQYLAAGITRIEVMAGDPDMLHVRDNVHAGKMVGPRMRIGSPMVDGPVPVQSAKMSWLVGDADGGKKAATLIAELGYDFAKPYSNLPANAYWALIEGCEARGIPVVGHMPIAVGAETICEAGRQDIAHAGEFFHWLQEPERSDLERQKTLAANVTRTDRFVQATVQVSGRLEQLIAGAQQSDFPDAQFCNPLLNKVFDPEGATLKMIIETPHFLSLIKDSQSLSRLMTRHLNDAGAKLVTGTDAPNPFLAEGFSLHEEVQSLVENCGLSNFEALQAITVNAAHCAGEMDAGVVAEGAPADLVLLNADPLQDITATRAIDTVLARGSLLTADKISAARQSILDVYAKMETAL